MKDNKNTLNSLVICTRSWLLVKLFFSIQFLLVFFITSTLFAQSAMINVSGRNTISLNGKWYIVIDPMEKGDWLKVWEDKKPENKTDFIEYSFDEGPVINVPGDFNTQLPELVYYEGTVWYKKGFKYQLNKSKRLFLHFGAVNYKATVYVNGKLVGIHEGGFTPFQFEITNYLSASENTVIVKANNQRHEEDIPSKGFDWFNYGGITRDVYLVETPNSFIEDYFIQLKKDSFDEVLGWIKLEGVTASKKVKLSIPELKINVNTKTDDNGLAIIKFKSKFELWSPENPKLYQVLIQSESDTIQDEIGFRTIATNGTKIKLNGESLFLKGVNILEEMPTRAAKAYSEEDAKTLLNWAKELGCNMVRLAHYPHSEYMVKLAEKMGLMVWEELPIYQHIQFSNKKVEEKMGIMLKEMVKRDKNRCGVIIWSLSNETYHFTPNRDSALIKLSKQCKVLDSTRLTTTVISTQEYKNNTFNLWDSLYNYFDVISVNEYVGWYVPWQGSPENTQWEFVNSDKPVIISEFGGEALYGNTKLPKDAASSWSEEYQEQIYKDQIKMFKTTPNLAGVCPWILFDYRSLSRMHPIYQKGWNRKGLLSEKGEKKKAWYIMNAYYQNLKN
ncbi:glycoside hydrolase family 2 protein [Flavisericum labens]|uniref:glycoside hydrolase family 2 protein n=1 Tax=Flavisericum labens TaxID=3377112 RepID=UPI00387B8F68